jgi:hypothetical protein
MREELVVKRLQKVGAGSAAFGGIFAGEQVLGSKIERKKRGFDCTSGFLRRQAAAYSRSIVEARAGCKSHAGTSR